MDKIRITKDENGAVILRFEKREECEKYTVYFRRENGRFKFLISTEKTAVRVNAGQAPPNVVSFALHAFVKNRLIGKRVPMRRFQWLYRP